MHPTYHATKSLIESRLRATGQVTEPSTLECRSIDDSYILLLCTWTALPTNSSSTSSEHVNRFSRQRWSGIITEVLLDMWHAHVVPALLARRRILVWIVASTSWHLAPEGSTEHVLDDNAFLYGKLFVTSISECTTCWIARAGWHGWRGADEHAADLLENEDIRLLISLTPTLMHRLEARSPVRTFCSVTCAHVGFSEQVLVAGFSHATLIFGLWLIRVDFAESHIFRLCDSWSWDS